MRRLADRRHYLPAGVLLVKRVAAVAGDRVCASGRDIMIENVRVAVRLAQDGRHRPMPWWQGCRRLRGRQLFLLTDDAASFDGRYIGPTEGAELVGKAQRIWPRA
jgi:type IV secretory pathway protease TraF